MPDPLVVVKAREHKTLLLAREVDQMAVMTRRWLDIEHMLDARITELAQDVADLGPRASRGQVYQLERYRALLAQARQQVGQYERWSGQLISDKQAEWGQLGINHAQEAIQTSFLQTGVIGADFQRLPVSAIEHMIGFAGDGAPLHDLLKEVFPTAWDSMERELLKSMAMGRNPRATAVAMKDGLAGGLQRALTISRTEQLRAYRMASRSQYEASGVVRSWRRLAAHDTRTCLGCLAAEGEEHSVSDDLEDH